jgi:hypothetical protein
MVEARGPAQYHIVLPAQNHEGYFEFDVTIQ